jgi:lipopolysaccharide export system ATP-binding protein
MSESLPGVQTGLLRDDRSRDARADRSTVLFRTENLTKVFGRRTVVNGVSLNVERGEIVGLLGPNGAGKTTTFRMAMGLLRPTKGRILLEGRDVSRLPMYQRARRGMGFLPQERSVFQRLTVEENLLAILQMLDVPRQEGRQRARRLLEEYGLVRISRQRGFTLSGGEARRLEIARALLSHPSLFLLDEPFSGIDPITVSEIQEIIVRLRQQRIGVLLTDHNVRETLSITDRAYIIIDGQVQVQGPRDTVVNDPIVRKFYLGEQFKL